MTNADGLGTGTHMSAYLSWQNAEHSRHYVRRPVSTRTRIMMTGTAPHA